MRKQLLLAVLVCACTPKEQATTDSMAAVMTPAPAALTAAMVAGSWSGMSMGETSDSVLLRWTVTNVSDTEGRLAIEGQKDTVSFTRTFDADSMIATSSPYTQAENPKGPKLTFRSVGRLSGDKLVGTVTNMLADKPDSVVSRGRWEATRKP